MRLMQLVAQNLHVGAGALFLHPGRRFLRELTVHQHAVSAIFLRGVGSVDVAGIQQLNQVPAEGGVNRSAGLAFIEAQNGVAEGRIEDIRRRPA